VSYIYLKISIDWKLHFNDVCVLSILRNLFVHYAAVNHRMYFSIYDEPAASTLTTS
jgi:hypothetical protein